MFDLINLSPQFCITFLILGLGDHLRSCNGLDIPCYKCSGIGPLDSNCVKVAGTEEPEPTKDLDWGRIRATDCEHPGYCYKTIEGDALVELGCLNSDRLTCFKKHIKTTSSSNCFELSNESQTKVHSCFLQAYTGSLTMEEKRYPPNRTSTDPWGEVCTCNRDYCNRDNMDSVKIVKCYRCSDRQKCKYSSAVVIDCPQKYCLTHKGKYVEKGCATTEYWGKCVNEFGNGGCYSEGTSQYQKIRKCGQEQYGFDIGPGKPGDSSQTCVCDKDLCNDKHFVGDLGLIILADSKLIIGLLLAVIGLSFRS